MQKKWRDRENFCVCVTVLSDVMAVFYAPVPLQTTSPLEESQGQDP